VPWASVAGFSLRSQVLSEAFQAKQLRVWSHAGVDCQDR
jgi:hypothetical protein